MRYLILCLAFSLFGCASTGSNTKIGDTMQLIAKTAELAPAGVAGSFVFTVKATGEENGRVFLNSEEDYRDRRNVSMVLSPKVITQVEAEYQQSPQTFFVNKKVQVEGTAKQVKVVFASKGKPTNKYYYQTHIAVDQLEQLTLLE